MLTGRKLPPRPRLEPVEFKQCYFDNGEPCDDKANAIGCWCRTQPRPIIYNSEAKDNHIRKLEIMIDPSD